MIRSISSSVMFGSAQAIPNMHSSFGVSAEGQKHLTRKPTRSQISAELHDKQVVWLRWVMEVTGKTASRIASESGLQSTTLTERLREGDHGAFSSNTIAKICESQGVPPPDAMQPNREDWPQVLKPSASSGAVNSISEEASPYRSVPSWDKIGKAIQAIVQSICIF